MSSQSSVSIYDDPVESFDKLNESLNSSTNLNNKNQNNDANYEEYTYDYYNTNGHHKLNNEYNIWYTKLSKSQDADDFESKLKIIGSFSTVQQFWALFSWLKRPSDLEILTEICIFKNGIKPMWENHQGGGKFILKFKKGVVSRLWENLLLAVLGEQFTAGDEITGVVLSIRHHFDALCVWVIPQKKSVIFQIRETLKEVLNLNDNFKIEYKIFNQQPQQILQPNQATRSN